MIRRILPELIEAAIQELLDHRLALYFTDLPNPGLSGRGVRGSHPRQQLGLYRVGVRKSSAPRRAVT